jgi:hypothetical protein
MCGRIAREIGFCLGDACYDPSRREVADDGAADQKLRELRRIERKIPAPQAPQL